MSGFREEALKLVTDNDYKVLVEVGVWKGELSRMLYRVAEQLYLVDPWEVAWNKFTRGTTGELYQCSMGEPPKTQDELDRMYRDVSSAMPNAVVIRKDSLAASDVIDNESVDFVYLDSVHTYEYCLLEIEFWLPKIKPGGMIAGDDYVPEDNAVAKAVDEMFGPQDIEDRTRTWSVRI